MKTTYVLVIGGILIILGMELFPPLRFMLGLIDTSGMPPIEASVISIGLPLFFLFFVGYLINKMRS